MGTVILGLIIVCIYFLPTVLANFNKHTKSDSIFIINLFLGWTLIGWVIALAWSVSENNRDKTKKV